MKPFWIAGLVGAAAVGLALTAAPGHAERAVPIPAPAADVPAGKGRAVAVLAGGCFWGMEAVFEQVKGVTDVTSGYAGGDRATANYAAVSTERTRHAEAVRITYDPSVVSYGRLLQLYFSVAHDPTQLNRQGPDSGPSYRSAIFPQSREQAGVAARYIAQLKKASPYGGKPIVTRIEQGGFFPAEAEHQDFARRNPRHPYILRWDVAKVAALKAAYPKLVRG